MRLLPALSVALLAVGLPLLVHFDLPHTWSPPEGLVPSSRSSTHPLDQGYHLFLFPEQLSVGGVSQADHVVVLHHGSPLTGAFEIAAAARALMLMMASRRQGGECPSLAVVVPVRPAYTPARRERSPGSALEVAREITGTLDALGVRDFWVIGHSGGVPFALAQAFLAPHRVRGVFAVSGVGFAPVDASQKLQQDLLDALREPEQKVLYWVLDNARFSLGFFTWLFRQLDFAHAFWHGLEGSLSARAQALDAYDRRLLRGEPGDGDLTSVYLEDSLVALHSSWGLHRDIECFVNWGFDVSKMPGKTQGWVQLYHGDADPALPVDFSRDLAARIPGAVFHKVPGAGHLLLLEVLPDLLQEIMGHRATS